MTCQRLMKGLGKKVKKVMFNKTISEFNDEQLQFCFDTLKDYMHIFGYAEKNNDTKMSEEWLQEQQEKYNFARYPDGQFDDAKFNQFLKFNEETMNQVLTQSEPKAYICNEDKTKQDLVVDFDVLFGILMDISIKERPQVKKE